jgi:hypothetical protein
MKATINGVQVEMSVREAREFFKKSPPPAPVRKQQAPKRRTPARRSNDPNKAEKASITFERIGMTLRQLQQAWTAAGLVTVKQSVRKGVVVPAGSAFSVHSVRPWLLAAQAAARAGWTREQFVAAATRPGSKIGNHCGWKP